MATRFDNADPSEWSAAAVAHNHSQLYADVQDHFDNLDLDALTNTVLNDTAPADRLTVIRAIDDMFGHIPHWDAQDGEL
ncbi:hypothetical protein [Streptomyces sp. NPDC047939]|uniref:hypothetical protein n=1 Tax=Streptomyces sp. NPDC047939 TaxID=3155381 RepID=UPI003441D0E7